MSSVIIITKLLHAFVTGQARIMEFYLHSNAMKLVKYPLYTDEESKPWEKFRNLFNVTELIFGRVRIKEPRACPPSIPCFTALDLTLRREGSAQA
jgi:hypothetical protein